MRSPAETLDAAAAQVESVQPASNGSTEPGPDPEQRTPRLRPEALRGLAGEVVSVISPQSEADPAALLLTFLACFGNAAGRGAYRRVEGDEHPPALFALVVGDTGKGRKGTSWGRIEQLMRLADPDWTDGRIVTHLGSGEGLIYQVRDPVTVRRRAKTKEEQGRADEDGFVEEVEDAGVADKRALVRAGEFSGVLKVALRDGSILSDVLREAWDARDLRSTVKTNPLRATRPHVSLVGHITREELRRHLTETEAVNGFANRFLFCRSRRSQLLAHGGNLTPGDLEPLAAKVRRALQHAGEREGPLVLTREAREAWEVAYPRLTRDVGGLLGAATGRGDAQAVRLALVYALLDGAAAVGPEHVRAGLAVWEYCEQSAAWAFGDRLGDDIADRILGALRDAGDGLDRTAIRDLFGRHAKGGRIDLALELLQERELVVREREETGGRPVQRWRAVVQEGDQSDESDQRGSPEGLSSLPSLMSQADERMEGAAPPTSFPASSADPASDPAMVEPALEEWAVRLADRHADLAAEDES